MAQGLRRGATRMGALLSIAVVVVTLLGGYDCAGATTPGASSADAVSEVEATQDLLRLIPADHRRWCARVDPATFADGRFGSPSAIVNCSDPAEGVTSVAYAQYADPSEAEARYDSALPAGLPESDASGTDCPSQGTWHFAETPDTTAGRDACSTGTVEGHQIATMAWTDDTHGIFALAFNDQADGATLKKWWNDYAGPLAQPEDDDELADPSPAARKRIGTRLADATPKVVKFCDLEGVNVSQFKDHDQPEWIWLPWLHASVSCRAENKGRVDYDQLNKDDVADYAAEIRSYLTDNGYSGTPHPAVCKTAKPLLRRGKKVGEVGCFYYHKTLWAVWYDKDQGTVADATFPHMSAPQLLDYLKAHKLT
jgi:hypothetical protein